MINRRRSTLVVLAIGFVLLAPVSSVAAHEGGGTISVESADPASDASVRYVVRLIWDNDGHPAAAADTTMTAVAVGDDGSTQTPVALEPVDDDGRFAATVEFPDPGRWTVRFTAVSPEATLEVPQQIDPPPTTSTAAPSTTSEVTPAATIAPAADSGDGTKAGTIIFVTVLLVLASAAFLVARRVRGLRDADAQRQGPANEQHE